LPLSLASRRFLWSALPGRKAPLRSWWQPVALPDIAGRGRGSAVVTITEYGVD
jgi:hypothetical protein